MWYVFQDVTTLRPEWEDGNFYLAKYYDKVMPMVTDNKLEKQGNLIRYIVTYFGKYEPTCLLLPMFYSTLYSFYTCEHVFCLLQSFAVWKPVHLPGHAAHVVSLAGFWSQSV